MPEAGFRQQQAWVICVGPKGRYGGLADNGMKEDFCRGIVAMRCCPRADRFRHPGQVSGLADEVDLRWDV